MIVTIIVIIRLILMIYCDMYANTLLNLPNQCMYFIKLLFKLRTFNFPCFLSSGVQNRGINYSHHTT